MATSGTINGSCKDGSGKSTSKYKTWIYWKRNSNNITGNYSNITVYVRVQRSDGYNASAYNVAAKPSVTLKVGGSAKTATISYIDTRNDAVCTFATWTGNVSHSNDGTLDLSLSCSWSLSGASSLGSGNIGGTATLDTIPRKSMIEVDYGQLGQERTITVKRQSTSFTHSIKAVCGNSTFYIKADGSTSATEVKHNDCSIPFTPPLSLASQNTTGTTVQITFTITTYNGTTKIGSDSCWIKEIIPASVKPSVSLAVSDSMGYADTFGDYVQGQSKFKIVVTASGSYGSTIKSYKTTADGKTYTAASITSGVISGSGKLTISTTVTDSRGRPATAETTVTVLPYSLPQISALKCFRCDAEGNANSNGEHLAIVFDSTITPLNNKNASTYELLYKKSTVDEYPPEPEPLTDFEGQYSVSGGVFILPAEKNSSYNIKLVVADSFTNTTKSGTGASIKKWFSILKSAFGFAIGKVAELGGVFDIALQTRFTGGILHPVLEPDKDLNEVLIPNTYIGANLSKYNYKCGGDPLPLSTGTFSLEVVGMGEEGQVKQRLTYCHKTASRAWERIYHADSNGVKSWGEWVCVSDFDGQLLWDGSTTSTGGYYMTAGHTATLSETISKQRSGIVLVFSLYNGGVKDQDVHDFFVPKYMVAHHNGVGHNFFMFADVSRPLARKYLYIHDDKIIGNDANNQTQTIGGASFNNANFVLRYVIGV